ncbi:hypothetical protein [Alkalibacterium pelagium]|uniref:Uncharacterized protein n=1 Tax=Alkalibacterium pelagium TaxID=426702 RepID=A0A1H7JRZ3_9LACT|nr:hypothetical protein [Alkalibacterium pelagium]GEN50563.1 hypothetical protein APE02nite_12280 [Alkalibacterium pelagium]SEK77343.1 hypothetical protein SAMN04488099_10647 [Alkalibacterium pelagium]
MQKNKKDPSITKIVLKLLEYLVLIVLWVLAAFLMWRDSRMDYFLINYINGREVSSVTFNETSSEGIEEYTVDEDMIDYFNASVSENFSNLEDVLAYPQRFVYWHIDMTRQPFSSISEDAHSAELVFTNGDSETYYFTESEFQVEDRYYTLENYNPFSSWMTISEDREAE